MAGSVNKVILVGNVGKDPEVRALGNGAKVANLSVATSETWRDKSSGERKEKTEWHRVSIFNEGLVKVVEQYIRKGAKLYIEGSLQTRKWTDQSGAEKYSTEVVLSGYSGSLTMLDGPSKAPEDELNNDGGFGTARPGTTKSPKVSQKIDDEIPFAWIAVTLMAAPLAFRFGGLA